MKLGIAGLPNVGKSTLFNALTKAGAQAANYPFCTIDPNVGIVPVPDHRLDVLAEMYQPEKITPATIEFVDIAGLVRGASKGEGLGNRFLAHIREVDAIVHVVRCFEDDNITHVDGSVAPVRDMETIQMEFVLADLEVLQKRYDKASKLMKTGEKKYKEECAVLEKLLKHMEDGAPARTLELSEEEKELVRGFSLLSMKPMIYAANVEEDALSGVENNALVAQVREEEERTMFLNELGLESAGLDRLVEASYRLLGLISYLTAGPKEVRAWTIEKGTKAPQAAGKIHSDFEKGFIRAEIVTYEDLVACGSIAAAREKGLYRSEGKEYVIQDGDVVLFRFNV